MVPWVFVDAQLSCFHGIRKAKRTLLYFSLIRTHSHETDMLLRIASCLSPDWSLACSTGFSVLHNFKLSASERGRKVFITLAALAVKHDLNVHPGSCSPAC